MIEMYNDIYHDYLNRFSTVVWRHVNPGWKFLLNSTSYYQCQGPWTVKKRKNWSPLGWLGKKVHIFVCGKWQLLCMYWRFLIRSRESLGLVIPNNKTIEHLRLKVLFYCNVVIPTIWQSVLRLMSCVSTFHPRADAVFPPSTSLFFAHR